jgi:hypothetical protein
MDVWELNPEGFGIVLADGLCDFEGIILAEGDHDWGMWAVLLLNYTLAFIFTTEVKKSVREAE